VSALIEHDLIDELNVFVNPVAIGRGMRIFKERKALRLIGSTGRPTRIVVAILRVEEGRLAEHWDVVQDEATKAESKSGLPMFGETFPQ
jgi:hypothetical protein